MSDSYRAKIKRRANALASKEYETIICVFPENIITRFDVSVNDVAEEFAEKLRIGSLARFYLFFFYFNLIIKRKMSKLNLTNDKNDDILYDR